jgi:hypothetical protein
MREDIKGGRKPEQHMNESIIEQKLLSTADRTNNGPSVLKIKGACLVMERSSALHPKSM